MAFVNENLIFMKCSFIEAFTELNTQKYELMLFDLIHVLFQQEIYVFVLLSD